MKLSQIYPIHPRGRRWAAWHAPGIKITQVFKDSCRLRPAWAEVKYSCPACGKDVVEHWDDAGVTLCDPTGDGILIDPSRPRKCPECGRVIL